MLPDVILRYQQFSSLDFHHFFLDSIFLTRKSFLWLLFFTIRCPWINPTITRCSDSTVSIVYGKYWTKGICWINRSTNTTSDCPRVHRNMFVCTGRVPDTCGQFSHQKLQGWSSAIAQYVISGRLTTTDWITWLISTTQLDQFSSGSPHPRFENEFHPMIQKLHTMIRKWIASNASNISAVLLSLAKLNWLIHVPNCLVIYYTSVPIQCIICLSFLDIAETASLKSTVFVSSISSWTQVSKTGFLKGSNFCRVEWFRVISLLPENFSHSPFLKGWLEGN